MSAGEFTRSFYQADYGDGTNIHPIKVQPETLEAVAGTNTNAVGGTPTLTSPISAAVGRGRRTLGLNARIIYLQITGEPPTDYAVGSRTRIPALTPLFYAAAIAPGAEVTYLGTTWKVIGSSDEDVR